MSENQYRPDIDGLRAIAVLLVVFFHFGFENVSGGFIGVDVFFVISGYLITRLITGQLENGSFSFSNFYIRRVRRLFPALFFTLCVSFVASVVLFSPQNLQDFSRSAVFAILSGSNFLFWLEAGYFDEAAELKPLLHTWSLSVEEQFYLIWPAALYLMWRYSSNRVVPVVLIIATIFSVVFTEIVLKFDPHAAFYLLPFRVAELSIGGLCVWIANHRFQRTEIPELLVVIGLIAIFIPAFTYTQQTPFPGLNALLPCLGTACLICGGQAKYAGSLLRQPLVVGVGLISYSLYLAHWPIFVFYKYWNVHSPSLSVRWLLIAVSILIAILMYFYVEKPFRRPSKNRPQLRPARFFLVCAGLALVYCVPATAAWVQNGWSWRLPDEIRFLVDNVKGKRTERFELYSSRCNEANDECKMLDDDRLNIIILGDSHGIDGFNAVSLVRPDANVLYAARGACPPFLEVEYFEKLHPNTDGCVEHNDWVFSHWESLREADYIVFSALFDDEAIDRLDKTIKWLRGRSNAQIVVLGTSMVFKSNVPKLIADSGRLAGIDNYIMGFADQQKFAIDQRFRQYYDERNIIYVSKLDTLCPGETCQIVVNDQFDLMTYDRHHLSMAATRVFAEALGERAIFNERASTSGDNTQQ